MSTSCRSPMAWTRASISGTRPTGTQTSSVSTGPEPLEGGVREAAGGEHRVGLGVVLRAGGPGGPGGLETGEDGLGLGDARGTGPSTRARRMASQSASMPRFFQSLTAVRQWRSRSSSARGHLPGSRHRRDGLAGPDERVEEPDDGVLGRAGRAQPHGDLGDEAEGALGADEQRHEVVPGDALGGLAADRTSSPVPVTTSRART